MSIYLKINHLMQRIIKRISAFFSRTKYASKNAHSSNLSQTNPTIIHRAEHSISRKQIDKAALDVLYALKRGGYEGYLVGGAVRDLLIGVLPKDFDVVTSAEPDQVKVLFKRQCRLIGRRFRLAHIHFGRKVIEVATFRGQGDGGGRKDRFGRKGQATGPARQVDDSGRLLRDNVYGTINEDVLRRDFTVNALYYEISNFTIVDYVGGLQDIEKGQLRLIGDPLTRYKEDPVRLIRAVRFAAKLNFKIEKRTKQPIKELAPLLLDVSNARLFEEVLKLFHSGVAVEVLQQCRYYQLFEHLMPLTEQTLLEEEAISTNLILEALKSTDKRIQTGKSVNPAFLFAAMLWAPLQKRQQFFIEEGFAVQDAFHAAANDVIEQQIKRTAIPKRLTAQMREIWSLQSRLPKRYGDRAQKLTENPRFRAAYDFLGIRAAAGEENLTSLFDWWTQYQEKSPVDQVAFANQVEKPKGKRRRNRRNRNFYRKRSQTTDNA